MATWGNTMLGQTDYVDAAANRARAQYDAGRAAVIREAGRNGVNPSSGAFMNLLNNWQYEKTAGVNAAANDAQYKYLTAAADQYNRDRAAGMDQQRIDNAENHYWTGLNEARRGQKAQYLHELGMFDQWKKYMQERDKNTAQNQNTAQNGHMGLITTKSNQLSWKPWTGKQWGWY